MNPERRPSRAEETLPLAAVIFEAPIIEVPPTLEQSLQSNS